MRLFDEGTPLPLDLISSTTFTTGVIHAVYGPAERQRSGGYQAKQHLAQQKQSPTGHS
jgi:hypothetical protein